MGSARRLMSGKRAGPQFSAPSSARCTLSSSSTSGASQPAWLLAGGGQSPVRTVVGAPPPAVRTEARVQQLRVVPSPVIATTSASPRPDTGSVGRNLVRTVVRTSSGGAPLQVSGALSCPGSPGRTIDVGGPARAASAGLSASAGPRLRPSPLPQPVADLPVAETPPSPSTSSRQLLNSGRASNPESCVSAVLAPDAGRRDSQGSLPCTTSVLIWTTDDEVTQRRSWTSAEGDAPAVLTSGGSSSAQTNDGTSELHSASRRAQPLNGSRRASPGRETVALQPAQVVTLETYSTSELALKNVVDAAANLEKFVGQMLQLCIMERDRADLDFLKVLDNELGGRRNWHRRSPRTQARAQVGP